VNGLLEADTRLFVLLNQHWIHPVLDKVMPFVTDFDHWRLPLVLVLLFALARGKAEARVGILFAILAVVAADQISSSGIKPLFERIRPFHVVEGTRKLIGAHGSSFPSSHAANTFAAGVFLALRFVRFRWILVIPFVVAYSRVYVGVHYPLDVLAGAVIGTGVGVAFAAMESASRVRMEKWLSFGRRVRVAVAPAAREEEAAAAGQEKEADAPDDQAPDPPAGARS